MKEIKVCVGYELDGKRIERFPFTMGAQAKLEPVYETFEGWSESTQGARSCAELPATASSTSAASKSWSAPGGPAQHLAQARRHDPDERSVPGLRFVGSSFARCRDLRADRLADRACRSVMSEAGRRAPR